MCSRQQKDGFPPRLIPSSFRYAAEVTFAEVRMVGSRKMDGEAIAALEDFIGSSPDVRRMAEDVKELTITLNHREQIGEVVVPDSQTSPGTLQGYSKMPLWALLNPLAASQHPEAQQPSRANTSMGSSLNGGQLAEDPSLGAGRLRQDAFEPSLSPQETRAIQPLGAGGSGLSVRLGVLKGDKYTEEQQRPASAGPEEADSSAANGAQTQKAAGISHDADKHEQNAKAVAGAPESCAASSLHDDEESAAPNTKEQLGGQDSLRRNSLVCRGFLGDEMSTETSNIGQGTDTRRSQKQMRYLRISERGRGKLRTFAKALRSQCVHEVTERCVQNPYVQALRFRRAELAMSIFDHEEAAAGNAVALLAATASSAKEKSGGDLETSRSGSAPSTEKGNSKVHSKASKRSVAARLATEGDAGLATLLQEKNERRGLAAIAECVQEDIFLRCRGETCCTGGGGHLTHSILPPVGVSATPRDRLFPAGRPGVGRGWQPDDEDFDDDEVEVDDEAGYAGKETSAQRTLVQSPEDARSPSPLHSGAAAVGEHRCSADAALRSGHLDEWTADIINRVPSTTPTPYSIRKGNQVSASAVHGGRVDTNFGEQLRAAKAQG